VSKRRSGGPAIRRKLGKEKGIVPHEIESLGIKEPGNWRHENFNRSYWKRDPRYGMSGDRSGLTRIEEAKGEVVELDGGL